MNKQNLAGKRKIIACICLIVAGLVIGAAFITATNYIQLGVAILLYPLLAHFVLKTFPRKTRVQAVSVQPQVKSTNMDQVEVAKPERENVGIADIDKRAFLKLIGGVGLSLFLFSIFNKKAEGLFFKSLPGSESVSLQDTDGNKIDPAQHQATDGYRISEIDDNIITYYGFTKTGNFWFIMREDTDTGSFRYVKGEGNFPGNWSNRENLKYDYYSNIFD